MVDYRPVVGKFTHDSQYTDIVLRRRGCKEMQTPNGLVGNGPYQYEGTGYSR